MRQQLYHCVVCNREYHPAKTRADFKGFCSMGCQHALAKQQGFGKAGGPRTEWQAIHTILLERRRTLPGAEPVDPAEDRGNQADPNLVEYRQVEDRPKHAAMMAAPDRWPVWPFLPMKRYSQRGGNMQTGYLIASAEDRFTIFLGLIAMARPETDSRMPYDSYDAMLADGWMVD